MASSPRIDELRKKFEENPRRYFAPLANEYRKAGDVEQAIAICREYLPQQPGHMSGHIVFGQALYEARTFEEAKTVFETALSLDPENLIALRHLGDISLITGDTESAKTWYKRVLEADPRNEEIQAQLASIEQASSSAPTPAITPAVEAAAPPPPPAEKPAAPSSAAATVVMQAVQIPARPPVTATSPTAEINVDDIMPAAAATPAAPAVSAVEPTVEVPAMAPLQEESAPALLEGLEATHAGGGQETPLSSFSLDGLETTSMASESAAPPAAATLSDLDFGPAGAPPPPPSAPAAATVDLDFGEPAPAAAPAEAPAAIDLNFDAPATPAAAPTAPPAPAMEAAEEPALDLDLGSLGAPAPAAPAAPASPPPAVSAPAPVTATADEAPLDLEISLPATPAAETAPTPVAARAPEPEPLAISGAGETAAEPPQPVTTSAPFMTETMAELYVQQGHREEALRVYRALLDQRPGDASLAGKVARLERELTPPAAASSAGPSIRELLLAIATRRPGHRPEFPSGNGASGEVHATESTAHVPSSVQAASPVQGQPHDAERRPDSLAGALGFPGAASHDEEAAMLLARAFRQNGHSNDTPLIAGAPTRPAADELSLRKVFKSEAPAPAPSSFSFDQFFSQRASNEPAAAAPEGQAAESAAEVAQFTQWLEGLKKR